MVQTPRDISRVLIERMSDVSDKRLERYRGQGQDGKLSDIVQQGQRAVSSTDPRGAGAREITEGAQRYRSKSSRISQDPS